MKETTILEIIISEQKELKRCIENNFTKRRYQCIKRDKNYPGKEQYKDVVKKPGDN